MSRTLDMKVYFDVWNTAYFPATKEAVLKCLKAHADKGNEKAKRYLKHIEERNARNNR